MIMDKMNDNRELLLMHQICSTLLSLSRKLEKQDSIPSDVLTARQYMVILAIKCAPFGSATMVNIARSLGTTKQNVNRIIPVLEKKGYVTRNSSKGHKNSVNINVTDSGLEAMIEFTGTAASVMMDMFDGFSVEELVTLLVLLQKLHAYDGMSYSGFDSDVVKLFTNDHSDLLAKILEEFKSRNA